MCSWSWGAAALLGLVGCKHTIKWGADTGVGGDVDTSVDTGSPAYVPCSEVTIDPVGPKAPVVGDTWIIWLDCDGARLVGPMVISWDPTDFVLIDDNAATFQTVGSGTVNVNSGRYVASLDVTVGPSDTAGADTGI